MIHPEDMDSLECDPSVPAAGPEAPVIDLASDSHFMGEALREARKAAARGEVPVGAVVVKDGRIIARAFNQIETPKDATAHAEMLALTQAEAGDVGGGFEP